MNPSCLIGLVNNAALLLALGLLYDTLGFRSRKKTSTAEPILTGAIAGVIGIAIMSNPWDFGSGVSFDTRSVLLCLVGFFFGTVPALLAVLMNGAFRLMVGGSGAWTGVAVIVTSGGIGLGWRMWRRKRRQDPSIVELYLLGIAVHAAMLAWMLTLPWKIAFEVLHHISLPVMLIHPTATAVLGALLVHRGQRKQSERNLEKSEEKFRTIFQHHAAVKLLIDPDTGNIVEANQAAQLFYGWSSAELGRMRIQDVNTLSPEQIAAEMNKAGSQGRTYFEFRHRLASGSIRDVEVYSSKIEVNGKELLHSIIHDVTERKRAQEALSARERVLEATQRLAKTGGWEWDVQKRTMTWTEETYRIHDLDPAQFDPGEGEHIVQSQACYAAEDRSVILKAFRRCVEDGEPYDLEFPFSSVNGRQLWIRTTAEAVRVDGRIVKVVGNIMDITEHKQAEARLTQSHELLSNLARLVPGVIYQYRLYPDGGSAFPYASPGINDIYEVTPEEVREDASPVFGRLHPEDRDRVSEAIFESARTLETFYCEFRVVLPRQALRWRWSQAHPERMPDGGTLWHGIISDITERKKAEKEKDTLNAQLIQAQKMESVGRLAGGVAHDYNNMLGVILGYTELALEKLVPDDPLRHDLQEILAATGRSADITRQLLAFSRQQPISPKVLDLNETVESLLKMLRRLIGEDIDLSWHPGARSSTVYMDATQVDQVLVNLCVNARDAIDDVGKISIETDTRSFDQAYCADNPGCVPGDFVLLAVSDDGCGMNPETREKIFEPFFTTKQIGKGTGLGLATVYGIVKQNNGFIKVYSEPGQGTTFRIYLPRHEGAGEQALKKDAVAPDARGSETLLLVEDEPTILRMTAMMLERLGYTVLAASSPEQAKALVEEHTAKIHLLMTDVVMPEMNGRELSARLQEIYPDIRVLFMSGYTADVIAHRGVLDKGVNFIQKPFSKKDLAVKVREALETSDGAAD